MVRRSYKKAVDNVNLAHYSNNMSNIQTLRGCRRIEALIGEVGWAAAEAETTGNLKALMALTEARKALEVAHAATLVAEKG